MTQKFNSRVSAEGALLIADAVAKNTKMSFLKAYGSTTEFSDDQLAGLTDKDLTGASHNQTGHISNVSVDDATSTVHTEIVLDGNTVEADYGLNSILMVATVDGNEHLFAVLKANQVQYMNAYDGKSSTNLQINCSFKVSNTDVVDIIKVDTAGTLTRADYDKLHEFTVSQVAVTVTNINKYTDTAMSKEAAARSAADSAENKARSDADTWETGQRTAADTTETNARIAADNAAASSVSKLTSTVAANYTSATVYADSAVAKEASARSAADSAETNARIAADNAAASSVSKLTSTVAANYTSATVYADSAVAKEASARSAADSAETNARIAADNAAASTRAKADSDLSTRVGTAQQTANDANANANTRMLDYQRIPANADLNDYIKPGFYGNSSDVIVRSMKNVPTNNAFSMIVNNTTGATQFLCEYMPSNAKIWYRSYATGKWDGAWHEIIQADQSTTVTGQYTFTNQVGLKIVNANQPGIILNAGQGEKKVLYSVGGIVPSGDGLAVGAGGLTVLGGGEAADVYLNDVNNGTLPASLTKISSVSDERAVIVSDSAVHLVSNLQNNDANAKEALFDVGGNLTIPGTITQAGKPVATKEWVQSVNNLILDSDRESNWTPEQCLANWPSKKVQHFKHTHSLGITIPSGYTSNYCVLTTKVPGGNAGYGGPIQIAELTDAKRPFTFKRVGISTTAWSSWEQITTW